MSRLRSRGATAAAQRRTRADLALPAHAVAAGRLQLPPPADLFGLWRRGDRAFRAMGRRLDDAGAAVALPALGHLGDRQRAADPAAGRAMVSALAVRTLARRQRALENSAALLPRPARIAAAPGTGPRPPHWFDVLWEGTTMRWKISHRGHDPRQIALIAIFALLVVIIAACRFFESPSELPSNAAFV